jgi:hypothetical protein
MSYFIHCNCALIMTPGEVLVQPEGDDGRTCNNCGTPIIAFRTTAAPDLMLNGDGVLSAGAHIEPVTLDLAPDDAAPDAVPTPANAKPL